ncbi:unnamed protein product, partial [Effrenium voratum]
MRATLVAALLLPCLATRPSEDLLPALSLHSAGGELESKQSANRTTENQTANQTVNQTANQTVHRSLPTFVGASFIATHEVRSNATTNSTRVEYELRTEQGGHSKVMLIFVVFLGLGFCGVDHCIVGNFILGTLKALTVGGFGFWFLLDWMLIVFNCVNEYSTLQGFGWDVAFRPCTIEDACRIGQITCLLHAPFVYTLIKAKVTGRSMQSSAQQPAISGIAFLRQKGLLSDSPSKWELDHVFETLDKNKDGFVSPTELKEGLRALGCGDITDEQVAQMMAAAGAEGKIHKVEPLGPGDQGAPARKSVADAAGAADAAAAAETADELGSLRPEAFARLPGSHLLRTCQDLAVQAHLYKLHSRLSEVRSGSESQICEDYKGQAFRVDNGFLRADSIGLGFRRSKCMQDLLPGAVAAWGSTVLGLDEGDGWLRVGSKFLPMYVSGVPVVSPEAASRAGSTWCPSPSSPRSDVSREDVRLAGYQQASASGTST